ncbi:hypothetical protein E4U09_006465 [Claviceps aff. purpurea]|uniref:Uncharacterized protein n=1 Tax=Claviceps aff. purpurea TaxID=1967640 RepID=A0A9P7QAL1_9HYPO|nr:hypothetical protein E4U38_006635 [Claviceps purpurea]KAG6286918.1 hypothetical protein E4U09_006465 [Claviceps aff. purpurea]KAG6174392.1 hypothetical protein E4U27_006520 [Claviceps purpurea]KAG6178538.1 hypothetical protein E4U36_006345 [Claviceps purpurea]KAG6202290.1 hypothetical protein E4U50_006360 [Claviceps purpurea]
MAYRAGSWHAARGEGTSQQQSQCFGVVTGPYQATPRGIPKTLVQMRTEEIGLREFLYRRNVFDVDVPFCRHCPEGPKTVDHVVNEYFECEDLRPNSPAVLP